MDVTSLFATKGDLLVGTGSGTVAKLAAGTDTYVLTADSSQTDGIKWAATAGTSPALTQLAETITSGSQSTVTFSSISGTHRHLRLDLVGQLSEAVTDDYVTMQFNGDTGANYDNHDVANASTGTTWSNGSQFAATSLRATADFTAATGPANAPGVSTLTIFDYARTAWHKAYAGQSYEKFGTSSDQVHLLSGLWRSTAAITSIVLTAAGGHFVDGSVVTLWALG